MMRSVWCAVEVASAFPMDPFSRNDMNFLAAF